MKDIIEEYGYIVIGALCAGILIGTIVAGIKADGFITKIITDYVSTIIGG